MKKVLLYVALCYIASTVVAADTITKQDIDKLRLKIKNILGNDVPDQVEKWLAVLDKNLHILNCLPTNRVGNCFKSNTCLLPELKFDGMQLKAVLSICKNPWKIVIDFELPKLPWWVDVKFNGIVIPIDHIPEDGVTIIRSSSTAKAKVLGVLNVYKANLFIDATMRWDCSKPVNDRFKRAKYNLMAPDQKYNSIWYKFKVRVEVKQKKYPCFCYKCKKCENLVDKSGSFGILPRSCPNDRVWYEAELKRRMKKCTDDYMRCVVRNSITRNPFPMLCRFSCKSIE